MPMAQVSLQGLGGVTSCWFVSREAPGTSVHVRMKILEQVLCTFEVSRFHGLVRSISCSLILAGVSGLCPPEVFNCAGARVSSGVVEGAGYVHVHVHVQVEVQVQV